MMVLVKSDGLYYADIDTATGQERAIHRRQRPGEERSRVPVMIFASLWFALYAFMFFCNHAKSQCCCCR
jgi:hypothetical protein